MPVLAACSNCAVKYSVGLSRAELTLLPVARSFWVVASSAAVDCSESRFWRTDAERTMPVILISFWMYTTDAPLRSCGEADTLVPRRYDLVNLRLRTNTRNGGR